MPLQLKFVSSDNISPKSTGLIKHISSSFQDHSSTYGTDIDFSDEI